MSALQLQAPAKINWTLEVLGMRPDGYHEVRTILQTINLYDTATLSPADELSLSVSGATRGFRRQSREAPESNIIYRAVRLLQRRTGCHRGVEVRLGKNIPVAAGLGGASSDAAAVLCGLRDLWGVSISDEELASLAAELGSDVPFFLRGGTALGSGRGDALELLPMPVERFAVVVTPPEPADAAKTKRLYGLLTPEHYTDGASTGAVVHRILAGKPIAGAMRNAFMQVAAQAYAHYDEACGILRAAGVRHLLLAGAGPSVFALVTDQGEADAIAQAVREAGLEAHAARLLGPWSDDGASATI